MTDMPVRIAALSEIYKQYDGFLIDQWGVLHNGIDIYPAALKALADLKAQGKKVVILSNSGRTGDENSWLMEKMGIARNLYDRVLSAGDDAYDALCDARDADYATLGKNVLLLARQTDQPPLFEKGFTPVDRVEEADFLFLLSMEVADRFPEGWHAILEAAARRGLPLICANPDFERVNGEGQILIAPGAIARHYEGLGGTSYYHGKPYPRIYRSAMDWLDMPAHRILAIGDSLLHDVAGARENGIDSLFIVNGVHRALIDETDPGSLQRELERYAPHRPEWVIDWLQ